MLRNWLGVTRALVVPLVRSLHWRPLLAGGLAGLGLAWLGTRWTAHLDPGTTVLRLRLAIVMLAVGAAFVLDDPSEPTTLSTPVSLLRRRVLRLALAAPSIVAWWGGLTWVAGRLPAHAAVPLGPLALEMAALLATVVALASAAAPRLADRCGGVAASSGILVLVGSAFLLPASVTLFAGPGSPQWSPAQQRLWMVTAVAAVAFVLASRDPGRPRGSVQWRSAVVERR